MEASSSDSFELCTLPNNSRMSGLNCSKASVDQQQSDPKRVKVVLVGDGFSGKTTLQMAFRRDECPSLELIESYRPTVFENVLAFMETDCGTMLELSIWDTAGQEEFDMLRPMSYPNTNAILLCFSIDSPDSFDNVWNIWHPELKHFCPGVPIILVGCKKDLRTDSETIAKLKLTNQGPVKEADGRVMAEKIGAVRYLECSSKAHQGVHEVFSIAANEALRHRTHKEEQKLRSFCRVC